MNKFDKVLSRANQVVFTLVQMGMYAIMVYVGVIIAKTIIAAIV
tara:strand:- start:351 stop:482 length:132 start_codon:yes stop_codon:yes gene_type:complete